MRVYLSKYDPEICEDVLREMREGKSVAQICRNKSLPYSTISGWLREKHAVDYARSQECRADFLADEIERLADEPPQLIVDDKGLSRIDTGWVANQRSRIDARKWNACKLFPRKYGDKVEVEQSGTVNIAVGLSPFTRLIEQINADRTEKLLPSSMQE